MRLLGPIRELTGGQIPPITRRALIVVAISFFIFLIVFKPQARVHRRAPVITQTVKLLPTGSPLAESEMMLDSSAIYLPATQSSRPMVSSSQSVQIEDTPLPGFDPLFRFSPNKPLDLPLENDRPFAPAPHLAIPLKDTQPFSSFGSTELSQNTIDSRGGLYEVYPISGATKPILSGKIPIKIDLIGNNGSKNAKNTPLTSNIEVFIGVDSMGLQSPGRILRSSGDIQVDNAIKEWSLSMDWGRLLPSGYYRIIVGP